MVGMPNSISFGYKHHVVRTSDKQVMSFNGTVFNENIKTSGRS